MRRFSKKYTISKGLFKHGKMSFSKHAKNSWKRRSTVALKAFRAKKAKSGLMKRKRWYKRTWT